MGETVTTGVKVDLDRIAKEIDTVFQKISLDSLVSFEKDSTSLSIEALKDIEEIVEESKILVKKTVNSIREEIKKELLEGRATIVVNSSNTNISVGENDHPEMENVILSIVQQDKSMLVGPAGTGKTYMISQIADKLGIPFYKYSCSRDSSVHDLLGYKQPQSETYLNTTFLQAYENGGVFLVDEYDAMSGDMSLFFNGIADSSKNISIPHRDDKPIATKHKDFKLIMCGNTWGKGSTDYSGRDFQDMALLDRFRFCRHYIGYHHRLEEVLMGDFYTIVETLRNSLEEVGSYLSTRNVEDMSKLLHGGISLIKVVDILCSDLDDSDTEHIVKNVCNIRGSSTPNNRNSNPQQVGVLNTPSEW